MSASFEPVQHLPPPPLLDGFGRQVTYLRVSVTDRCDLRCAYCLPQGFRGFIEPDDWLTLAETARVVAAFARMGVRRVRLTGGEPLLRRHLPELAARIVATPPIEDVALTTNGTRLRAQADALWQAGVRRLNVSLDSLRRDCVQRITGRDCLHQVLDGLQAAQAAGFARIHINMVPLQGVNDGDVADMVAFCMAHGFVLRLIETMPMGHTGRASRGAPLAPLLRSLQGRYQLRACSQRLGGGPAQYWEHPASGFMLGLITPLSQHFCQTCNRVRLAVDGTLHLCLGQDDRLALRPMLRAGCSDAALDAAIRAAIARKPEKHLFTEAPESTVRFMSMTGG